MRTSPLMATAIVWAGIGLLALPLRTLTAHHPVASPPAATTAGPVEKSTEPAVLRLRLLMPAQSVELRGMDDTVLWRLDNPPAGEAEKDVTLPIEGNRLELTLTATFAAAPGDTAVFLTVMPDGREQREAHAIGSGTIDGHLSFIWPES